MAVELERMFLGRSKGQLRRTLAEITQPKPTGASTFYSRNSVHVRTPDILTTRAWLSRGEYIALYVNPSTANWSINRRATLQKTSAGFVLNAWRNRSRNTYFDDIPIQFNFQAGNIMPSTGVNVDIKNPQGVAEQSRFPQVPPGLNDFYRYLSLTDQGILGGVGANYHIIVYHSRVFPQLWLEGWFDPQNNANFTETIDAGNTVTWSATFICTKCVPRLSSASVLQGLYADWLLTSGAINEQLPLDLMQSSLTGEVYAKMFADWGWGEMPTDGDSKSDPTRVARTKTEDPFAEGIGKPGSPTNPQKPGQVITQGAFDNSRTIGKGTIGTLPPRKNTFTTNQVISQSAVGNVNPYDSGPVIW